MRTVALALIGMFCLAVVGPAKAGDSCGKADCCGKTCRVVCTMKEVKKTVWAVECEYVCPTLPGCCQEQCCGGCGAPTCGAEGCCAGCGKSCTCGVPPHCGKVRAVKKLVKKEIICHVPVYKCEVVGCCGGGCDCGGGAPMSAPPKAQQAFEPAPLPRF